ncbi:MAG: hypothetical protein MR587_06805, partial [Megasphaera elsdenii]|nr:hypothetical protein [Megasphaera elsdenii]
NSNPTEIKLQATVWHKLFIYIALFLVVLVLIIVLIMEHRRKNVISWKRAAHMRKVEMMLLCIPIIILGYMGYEYYVGTHVTAASLDKVAEQQQEELLENREEDKRLQDADARKQRSGEMVAARIRSKANDISNELRNLKVQYRNGAISRSSARSQAQSLAQQAKDMLNESTNLSQADREVLEQLIDNVVAEADSIGASAPSRSSSQETRRSESTSSSQSTTRSRSDDKSANTKSSDSSKSRQSSDNNRDTGKTNKQ